MVLNKNRKKKALGEFHCSIKIFLLSDTAAISVNSWGIFDLAFFPSPQDIEDRIHSNNMLDVKYEVLV